MIPELKDTMCITQILEPQNGGYSPLTKAECEEIADQGYGNNKAYCNYNDDYWAGAVKACGGVQNMPTQAQLTALAEYIYPDADSINSSGTTNANWDADRVSLFLAQSPGGTSYFTVWSGQEYSQYNAYYRGFSPTDTYWYDVHRVSNSLAVCLDQ